MIKSNLITLPAQDPITFDVKYIEISPEQSDITDDSHVHPECEIYINLSGDVSFMVEKSIYPITPGNVVITRPYEYHHCIYHTDKPHRHFWILFSVPTDNSDIMSSLFSKFFKRNTGEGNLLSFSKDKQEELLSLCHKLTDSKLTLSEKYCGFYTLIQLLNEADTVIDEKRKYPQEIDTALMFIDKNFTNCAITVADIANHSRVSVNTLERHFRNTLSISPGAYLKKKRLAHAAKLLFSDKTVTEACNESGFSDYSHFISLFKSSYGITPLKYKKSIKS